MKQEREQEGVLRPCQPAADHYVYAQTGTLVGRNTSVVACKCVRQELSVLNDNKWSGQIGEHVGHQCKELRNQGAAMGFKEEVVCRQRNNVRLSPPGEKVAALWPRVAMLADVVVVVSVANVCQSPSSGTGMDVRTGVSSRGRRARFKYGLRHLTRFVASSGEQCHPQAPRHAGTDITSSDGQ